MAEASLSARVRTLDELPGPRGWPLMGNALQFKPSELHLAFERWQQQFGDFFCVRLGARPFVVISDPALITEILRARPERFSRGSLIEPVFTEMGLIGIFPAEGEDWRRQRRIWLQAFNAQHLKPFFDGLTEVTGRLLRRWQQSAQSGDVVDVQADLMRYTVDITTRFAFGTDTNTLEQKGDVIQQQLETIFPALYRRLVAPFPYWRYIKLPADRAVERAFSKLCDQVSQWIGEARQRMAANPELRSHPGNFLEAMVAARDEDGPGFSDIEVIGNTIGALLAGEDTTANTLAWMMYFIADHPDVQRALQQEADQVLGAAPLLREYADTQKLRYADAVASETLRLKPVAPFIGASCLEPVMLRDVALPAGTDVFLLMRVSAAQRVAAPDAFRPERWLTPDAADTAGLRNSMPFGNGARTCPGRNLALAEIKAVTAMLARNFELERVAGVVTEQMSFTMTPVNLKMRLKQRG